MTTIDDVNKYLERILEALSKKSGKSEEDKEEKPYDIVAKSFDGISEGISRTSSAFSGSITGAIKGIGSLVGMLPGWGKAIGAGIKALGEFTEMILKITNAFNDYSARNIKFNTDMFLAQAEAEYQKTDLMNQSFISQKQRDIDISLKELDTYGENYVQELQVKMKQFVAAFETPMNVMTKGINEAAYEAMRQNIDINIERKKFDRDKSIREAQLEKFTTTKETEYETKIANNFAKSQEVIADRDAKMAQATFDNKVKNFEQWAVHNIHNVGLGGAATLDLAEDNELNGESFGWNDGGRVKARKDYYKQGTNKTHDIDQLDQVTGNYKRVGAFLDRENRFNVFEAKSKSQNVGFERQLLDMSANYEEQRTNKILDIYKRESEIRLEQEKKLAETWLNLTQTVEEWLNEFDKHTNDLGKSYGYTNKKQLDDFQNSMFIASEVAAKFGKKIEDVVKLQQSFIESTGRNKLFGRNDYNNMMRLGSYLGDDGLAASYTSEMEIFNAGVSDSVDMLGEVINDVNRMGLNGRKYTKTLVENLKLAQKYNFKGGTKGLMEMAKWAENTRFNMGALSSQLDKISEGGLEGVITQGAQFQVLGGHAAMNADPIAMMFERYADPQALMKRYQDMTKGYGRIDKKTGETIFSVEEQMLMEQIAKVRGISTEDVMNEVRARNKRETVAKHLNGSFDEDQQAFISNNATYNKERGTFQVKVKRGDEYKDVDVDQLTEEDLKEIMPADYQEHMLKNMDELVPLVGKLAGEKERQITSLAKDNYDQYKDEVDGRIEAARTKFAEQYETYTQQVSSTMAEITGNFKSFLDQANTQNDTVTANNEGIAQAQGRLEEAIHHTAVSFNDVTEQMVKIAGKGEQIYRQLAKIVLDRPDSESSTSNSSTSNSSSTPQGRLVATSSSRGVYQEVWETPAQTIADYDTYGNASDAILSSNNHPMVSAASNVTKINDGLVSTHPNDVGIFAKEGGVIGKFLNDLYNDVHNIMLGGGGINANTLKVEMSGSLDLQSAGQSINIITELQNNPMLLRALSQLLVAHMTNAINGGRGTSIFGLGSV